MPAAFAEVPLTRWRGYALGAEASLTIRDPDLARAKQALRACVAEIERIEQVFSLYRKDSVLCALNTEGILADPPAELVDVLSFAAHMSLISEDAFDVTVQPLWNVYVHAQRDPRALFGELELARSRIGWRRLSITRDRLAFELPNMAATLNGIAQGYATDRIAKLLRLHGFSHVLVNLGEYGAYGERAAGAPWRIGVAWPDREGLAAVLSLSDRAIATSSPLATPFDKNGEHHHLFDPRTGRSARSWTSVSVVAPSAMRADALSTAIAVAPKAAAEAILGAGGGLEAILIDGERVFRIRA
jgi:thiamine biosynthesis lipoprotein